MISRYTRPEMGRIWSEENGFQKWLEVEILAAEGLASDPRPVGCRKMAGSENRWRLRVGDYRVVYEIDDTAEQVLVVTVGHRREVYR